MSAPAQQENTDASPASHVSPDALLASLYAAGAHRFDPVRWHYIDTLTKRAAAHDGLIRQMLDARLAQALTVLKERFELAHSEASESAARSAQQFPDAADDLQRLAETGDFRELRRLTETLKHREQCASLSALVRQLDQASPESPDARMEENGASRLELKTVRDARNTWSRLSIDKQVSKALEQAPQNAGPINSHMLALRSLAMMRDHSPDYLTRFMSYAETLLVLDQGENEKPAAPRKKPAAKPAKK